VIQDTGTLTPSKSTLYNQNFDETVNGDGTPFPAKVGSKLKDGGVITGVNADGTYDVQKNGKQSRIRPQQVFLAKRTAV